MSTTVLYTPDVLGLATALSRFPMDDGLTERAEARSRSCGSTISLGLALAPDGTVDRVGVRSQACAIGQAAAAIFASGAKGMTAGHIQQSGKAIADWLEHGGEAPDWPNLGVIAAARDYPGRHGAVLLPWIAADQILSRSRG